MTTPATLGNDLTTGLGIDCLDIDRLGAAMSVGRHEGRPLDVPACGGADAAMTCLACGGADVAGIDAIPQTGADGDGSALLLGATGCDTLEAAHAALPVTGRTTTFDLGPATLGANMLWVKAPVPPAGRATDLRLSFILHQVEHFSFRAPAPVHFRMGCAR